MGNEVKIVVTGEDKSNTALTSATKNVDGMGASLKRMGEVAGGVNLADQFQDMSEGAKQFLSSTTDAASGLEQSMGAVDSVFKGSADQIHAWGDASAQNVGMSERAFNEAATSIGGLLNNLGFNMEETTSKTGDLTSRAADMAAMFGGDTSQAIEAVSSALRGESDPIERYGVMLNEATVNAKALAMTGKSTADSLTMQEKAAARLALIMEQTSDAQGTFARESDTVAGSQQRMSAAIEDAQAALGGMFAPVVKLAADAITALVSGFENLPGPIKLVVGSLAIVVAGAVAIAPAVTAASTAMGAMGVSAAGLRSAVGAVGSFLTGPWGLAIAAGVTALTLFGIGSSNAAAHQAELQAAGKTVNDVIREQNGVINDNVRKKAAAVLEEKGLLEVANKAGISGKTVVDSYLKQGDSLEKLRDQLNKTIDAHSRMESGEGGATLVMDKEGAAAADLLQKLDDLVGGRDADSEAAQREAEASGEATGAAEEHKKSIEELYEAMMEFVDASLSYRNANAEEVAAHEAAVEAINKHGEGSAEAAQATRDWEGSILSAVQAAAEYNASLYSGSDAAEKSREATEGANAEIMRLASLYGESAPTALRQMVAGMDTASGAAMGMKYSVNEAGQAVITLPNGKTVTLDTLDYASPSVRALIGEIAQVRDKTVTISMIYRQTSVTAYGTMNPLGGYEHGGIVSSTWGAQTGGQRHGSTLINEAGPEVAELPNGSWVATAGATRALAEMGAFSGGGGGPMSVSLVADAGADSGAGQWIQSLIRRGVLRLKVNSSGQVVVG